MKNPTSPYHASRFERALLERGAGAADATGGRLDVRRRRDVYYGEIAREAMRALLDKLDGARDAEELERIFAQHADRYLYEYAFDDSRSDWIELFLHAARPVALDYGAGLGNFTMRLAPRCAEVWAVDATPERLDLVDRRARAAAQANVFTLLADHPADLPFPAASFDLILLNGVLEWTAVGAAQPPEAFHRELLAALARLLKPGGALVVAIENRWSLFHFIGQTEHNDFKFAPLLPRAWATWVSRRVKGAPYETYTYSARALRRLLREAGLARARLYWAFPSYQQARLVARATARGGALARALATMLPGGSLRWRALRAVLQVLAWLRLMPMLAPAFIIEGKKQTGESEVPGRKSEFRICH